MKRQANGGKTRDDEEIGRGEEGEGNRGTKAAKKNGERGMERKELERNRGTVK